MINLSDRVILVTRPDPQGGQLVEMIAKKGGKPIFFPTIAFVPPPDEKVLQRALQQLGDQDYLIFISPQAVYSSVPFIRQLWPELSPKAQFFAIGAGTKKALHDAGYVATLCPPEEWNSEGLLAMPAFHSIENKKIAVFRGMGGRELVDQILSDRGAQVLPVIVYERIKPHHDTAPLIDQLKHRTIDALVCTSFEGVQNLKDLVGEEAWPLLQRIPLFVVSERIKSLAHDLGFQTIWVTQRASNEAILERLMQVLPAH